jgi:DNA-binding SARP family transcriptional activator/class 3 adenylate cyclase/WD40 repeat protein/energy-coupling factor transporter ATP-binding protein EcfA2
MTGATGDRATRRGRGRRLLAVVTGGAADAPVETWTVLFTDQVGSTAMRVRVGEDAFDGIRADLDARVAAALTAHGVVVTKSTGDGVMGGFTSTAAALRCAVAIQQSVGERNRAVDDGVAGAEVLSLRMGISVGDAVVDQGDLQGTAVVEAARLCAAAAGGTILCSEAVRVVSANRSGCTFGPASQVHLKGLPGPVMAQEVAWEPLPYDPRAHRLSFRVLGPLEVLDGERPVAVVGTKERHVLALLLARVNSPVSVDALVDALWGDYPPRTAQRTVHAHVARLRRNLEPRRPRGEPSTLLATVGRSYELRLDAAQLDAIRFEELAKRGSDQLERGDSAASSTLRQALGLWRGEAFGEFPEVEGCVAAAHRLTELRLALIEDLVDADLADGRSSDLVVEIETLLRNEPFHERLWAQLMLALYRAGRQRDALDAYQRARRLLADELGIEPGPDLRRLEAAVLAQDPSLDVLRRVPAAKPGGLPVALSAVGAALVGRQTELEWLRGAWANAVDGRGGFVSVLGPEGIGKTRLVAEFAAGAHNDGATVLYGRCDHAHRGARALLGQALQSAGSSLGDVDGGAGDPDDIAEAVARHLPTWSQGHPILVVLDDLHLADAETLEVVADLAGWCRAAPMLVVGAFRGDTAASTGTAEPPGGAASQLALGPLSGDAVGHICELYATEPWSAQDVDRVYELTGGVPLLVHEQASEWARERTSRRMAEATDRMAVSHRRLVVSRGEIADGVESIRRLLEQRRAQLAGREAQRQATLVAALEGCPYKGLARFEAADAANFFGRERLVAELVARLAESPLLAVVGPSGSGKSSLVRAGLLPALTAGVLPGDVRWHSAVFCPGPHPSRELTRGVEQADRSAGERRIVFVDQFEETFTTGAARGEQEGFINRLLELVDRPDTAVVLAIRADHLGRCATYPELADRLTGNDVLVGPMRDAELRRTVELPAHRAGLEIEHGLVELIVGDVAGRAGALPLLSTALAETWERREARALTVAGYRAAGGVNGALARMAEDAYAALPAGSQAAARRLLLRLCDAGDAGDLTLRRRLPIAEATDEHDANTRAALETLTNRRLLTIDSDAVEIAHEALLHEWPRLHTWLEEDLEGRRLHQRLHDGARAWEAADRDPSELHRGGRLQADEEWAAAHPGEPSATESAFLEASRTAREQQERSHRHIARRLRTQVAALSLLLVVAMVTGAVALVQSRRAGEQRDAAEATARESALRALVSDAASLRRTRPDRAALLAVESHRIDPGPASLSALFGSLTDEPGFSASIPVRDAEFGMTSGVVLPDGPRALVTGFDGRVRVLDLELGIDTGQRFPEPNFTDLSESRLALSADGKLLAQVSGGSEDTTEGKGRLVLYDVDSREMRVPPIRLAANVGNVAVSPDGRWVVTAGGSRAETFVHRADTGDVILTIPGLPRPADSPLFFNTAAVAFDDAGRLFVSSEAGPVRIFAPSTFAEVGRLPAPPVPSGIAPDPGGTVLQLAVSPDGRTLVGISEFGNSAAWDLDSGTLRWSRDLGCYSVAIGPGSNGPMYCGLATGGVVPIDLATGEESGKVFDRPGSIEQDVVVTRDGTQLLSIKKLGPIGLWRLDGGGPIHRVIPAPNVVPTGYSNDGRQLLFFNLDNGHPSVWDPVSGLLLDPLDDIVAAMWTTRSDQLAVQFADGTGGTYNHETKRRVVTIRPTVTNPAPLRGAAIDAANNRMLVWLQDGRHTFFDIATGEPTGPQLPTNRWTNVAAFTPDGRHVALVDGLDGVTVFDATTGDKVAGPILPDATSAAISADGLLVVARAEELLFYDPLTLEPRGQPIPTRTGIIADVAFSADGSLLRASGHSGTLLIDVPTRTPLGDEIEVPLGNFAAALRPDGAELAVSTTNGVALWDLDPSRWVEAACRRAGRNLSESEWATYIGDLAPYHRTCAAYP